jgi:hypothetical protein
LAFFAETAKEQPREQVSAIPEVFLPVVIKASTTVLTAVT